MSTERPGPGRHPPPALNLAEAELCDLLARLARFFTAHEGSISTEQAVHSLHILSHSQRSALYRFVSLIHQRPKEARQQRRRRQSSSSSHDNRRCSKSTCLQSQILDHHSPLSSLDDDILSHAIPDSDLGQHNDRDAVPATDQTNDTALNTSPVTSSVTESIALYDDCDVNDDTSEPSCSFSTGEIQFAPSTKRLLEACITDRTRFLDTITKAKVILPTGQGWEAAIATKNENTDIRDLMRIYHRFECYNIYWHVVKAGFHTGTHWIRDMRLALLDRLCQNFPERFSDREAAKKCLTWVDQGSKYREWAATFSATSDLGYLIALPSNIPHSTYTSRCSKEKMSAAATEFISLGIHKLVENLELSKLAKHLVLELRELTAKNEDSPDYGSISRSRHSCSLHPDGSVRSNAPALSPYSKSPVSPSQSMTPASEVLLSNTDHTPLQPPIRAAAHQNSPSPIVENLRCEHTENVSWQDQHTAGSSVNDFTVILDPFMNFEMTLPSTSPELFGSQHSGCVLPTDTWYQHTNVIGQMYR